MIFNFVSILDFIVKTFLKSKPKFCNLIKSLVLSVLHCILTYLHKLKKLISKCSNLGQIPQISKWFAIKKHKCFTLYILKNRIFLKNRFPSCAFYIGQITTISSEKGKKTNSTCKNLKLSLQNHKY